MRQSGDRTRCVSQAHFSGRTDTTMRWGRGHSPPRNGLAKIDLRTLLAAAHRGQSLKLRQEKSFHPTHLTRLSAAPAPVSDSRWVFPTLAQTTPRLRTRGRG